MASQDVSGNQMKPDVGLSNAPPSIVQTIIWLPGCFLSVCVEHFLSAADQQLNFSATDTAVCSLMVAYFSSRVIQFSDFCILTDF